MVGRGGDGFLPLQVLSFHYLFWSRPSRGVLDWVRELAAGLVSKSLPPTAVNTMRRLLGGQAVSYPQITTKLDRS